jgi:hypothetical protein
MIQLSWSVYDIKALEELVRMKARRVTSDRSFWLQLADTLAGSIPAPKLPGINGDTP